jgi:hypothetical protein
MYLKEVCVALGEYSANSTLKSRLGIVLLGLPMGTYRNMATSPSSLDHNKKSTYDL